MKKITIITATYNCASTLEQALYSVYYQDYSNIEHVIVDGGSTDGTVDIIKKYETKYHIIWLSEADDGLYHALNKGISLATGDYFLVLGADDALYKRTIISKLVNVIDDETDILSGAVVVVDENSGKQYVANNKHARDKISYHGGMVPHQGLFVRTSLGKRVKFDTRYHIVADYKFFLQCYYNEKINIKFIDEIVAYYSNGGISSRLDKMRDENNNVYKELKLPLLDSEVNSYSNSKRIIKNLLKTIKILKLFDSIYSPLRYFINKRFLWQKHKCDNKKCRWCRNI